MAGSMFIVFLIALTSIYHVSALKVTVYYESLCPDSIRFITRQLYPTYQQLSFDVEFIPYGKAAHITNPWTIRCQHGANECYGNAVQACALDRIEKNADQVEFVNCVMSDSYPPLAGRECADKFNLSYDGVPDCSTGEEGRSHLVRNGDKTHSLQPSLVFVPTIIINDKFSKENQDAALTDLKSLICKVDSSVTGC